MDPICGGSGASPSGVSSSLPSSVPMVSQGGMARGTILALALETEEATTDMVVAEVVVLTTSAQMFAGMGGVRVRRSIVLLC